MLLSLVFTNQIGHSSNISFYNLEYYKINKDRIRGAQKQYYTINKETLAQEKNLINAEIKKSKQYPLEII